MYKVIDSSDVVIHILDARDPLGTRCRSVEKYIRYVSVACSDYFTAKVLVLGAPALPKASNGCYAEIAMLIANANREEAPHKHLIFILNKCDLVPTGVAVSLVPNFCHYNLRSHPSTAQSRLLPASTCYLYGGILLRQWYRKPIQRLWLCALRRPDSVLDTVIRIGHVSFELRLSAATRIAETWRSS